MGRMNRASELFPRRISIFCGNYGSGKTEISLNAALFLRQEFEKTALVDLDIVNPYFRSAEQRAVLESAGIRVLAPTFAMTTVDIPGLPAQIQSVFDNPTERVIFDVGGDETGSVALGRYKPYFDKSDREMLFVVNALRPFSNTPEAIAELYSRICQRARMTASALINNTNFGAQTSPEDIIKGEKIVREAAALLDLPVRMTCVSKDVAGLLPDDFRQNCWPIDIRMRPEWM